MNARAKINSSQIKVELVRISQCSAEHFVCAVALFPHSAGSKFQAEIKAIMVIKNNESIRHSKKRRKMVRLGRNNPYDSYKCVYLSTSYFSYTQNASYISYLSQASCYPNQEGHQITPLSLSHLRHCKHKLNIYCT